MAITLDQLKKLKTYELAEMLTNVVLLLKSMPDIECGQLLGSATADVRVEPLLESFPVDIRVEPLLESFPVDIRVEPLLESFPVDIQVEPIVIEPSLPVVPLFTREELKKKTVANLKILAKSLNVFFTSSVKKDELIHKILVRPLDGKSEQHAIRDL